MTRTTSSAHAHALRALVALATLALSTCVDASGELELTITASELCSGIPGATELTDAGIIIVESPVSLASLPEFSATFSCRDLDDGVLFEELYEFPGYENLDVIVIAGVRRMGMQRSAAGCRDDLITGAAGTTPCVLAKRWVGVAHTSVTRTTIDVDGACSMVLCNGDFCGDQCE